jgi:hypothetical protein
MPDPPPEYAVKTRRERAVKIPREYVVKIPPERKGRPPVFTPRERRGISVDLREVGRAAGEIAKKMATGLEAVARRVETVDAPRLTRNVLVLATGGMTLYLMFSAISVMAPQAVQVYAQFGRVLGFMIPLMFMMTVFSIVMAIIKYVVG